MRKVVIYGKDDIGRSATVSNVPTAIATTGLTVMQIGCDPKADSACNPTGGESIPTVLSTLREESDAVLEDIVVKSPPGVLCVESGGPAPGVDCVGRDIITAFGELGELDAYEIYRPNVILHDVLGDVVCGGFVIPIRDGYADRVRIVTSGEMMSLYAAFNITHAVKSFGKRGYAILWELVLNARNVGRGNELVDKVTEEIEAPILYRLPRHPLAQQAEAQRKTVIEVFPDSDMATHCRELVQLLIQETVEGGCSRPV